MAAIAGRKDATGGRLLPLCTSPMLYLRDEPSPKEEIGCYKRGTNTAGTWVVYEPSWCPDDGPEIVAVAPILAFCVFPAQSVCP